MRGFGYWVVTWLAAMLLGTAAHAQLQQPARTGLPSRRHFDRAVELAFETGGVAAVESRLTVEIARPSN